MALGIAGEELIAPPPRPLPLTAQSIEGLLRPAVKRWARSIEILASVDSTNRYLSDRAAAAGVDGLVVTAECQTGGRGRLGRQWHSPLGASIALSIGYRCRRPAAALEGLSLAVGLGVLEALDPEGHLGLALKWPNDVLGPAGKLSGILVEVAGFGSSHADVIIGIGVNYQLPAAVVAAIPQATQSYLELTGSPQRTRNELIGALLNALIPLLRQFDGAGFEPFVDAFNGCHHFQGKRCLLSAGADAESPVTGVVLGVDDRGQLRLSTDAGIQLVAAGELSLRPVPER